ncbi:MAG TPA: hypothetical protein VEK36_01595 [Candidatus Paceibacterota bacterium]|nr:hypothetical protein [Candidatus Paceibacterota bacterium]
MRSAVTPLFWINILLVMLVIYLIAYYVMGANSIATRRYQIKALNEESAALTEKNTALASQRFEIKNLSTLAEFALNRNMIIANDVTYIFEASNVALKK